MKRSIFIACCSVLMSVTGVSPAVASCIQLPRLSESLATSQLVFVGEVVEVTNNDRTATVEVIEIWKGSVPEGTVEIVGGAEGANTASSVDRTYRAGVVYLFVPDRRMKDGRFSVSSCSPTRPYRDRFDRLRPATAQIVSDGDRGESGTDDSQGVSSPLVPIILGGAALLVLISLAGYLARKRRSPAEDPAGR